MATIDILGVPHAYDLTAPTASPHTLVFIHGWLLSRGYWQPLIERLASDYQCLSYDLRGFGDSQLCQSNGNVHSPGRTSRSEVDACSLASLSVSSSSYAPAAYAQDLVVLLRELNLNKVWLIGHSLGGTIALWAAGMLPDAVQGVFCLNSGGGIYLKEEFERFRGAGQQILKLRPRWLCRLPLLDLLFTRASVANPIPRCWGRQRIVDFVTAHQEAALGTLLDSTTEAEVHTLPQLVSQLQQPVYFVAGDRDPIMEPQYVRHLASFHSLFQAVGDNVIEIEDCGHLAMVEQPDRVAAKLRGILTKYEREQVMSQEVSERQA